jgi:nitrite reductase/ring-hydroxylating ferredoxin subunit
MNLPKRDEERPDRSPLPGAATRFAESPDTFGVPPQVDRTAKQESASGERKDSENSASDKLIPHCSMQDLRQRTCVIKWLYELRDEVAVMLIDGNPIVRSSVCPHFGGEFDFRAAEAMLECKWHGWRFDARTGECRNFRIGTKLRAYPFEIINGIVYVKYG